MNDETRRRLREMFADILGVARVGTDDSFLTLGGDSLTAMRLVDRVRAEFGARLGLRDVFDAPTPAALATVLSRAEAVPRPSAPTAAPHDDRAPLSFAQRGVWFLERLDGPGADFTVPLALRLTGPLDQGALRAAVDDVVIRHEALRTVCFRGVPEKQVIEGRAGFQSERVEESQLDARLEHLVSYTFDLNCEIPLRAWLLQVAAEDHLLLLLTHRIAADETSLGLLVRDIGMAYSARREQAAPRWPRPLPGHPGLARWQAAVHPGPLDSARLRERKKALTGMPDELALPYDRPRPAVPSRRVGEIRFRVGAEVHRRLADLAGARQATLFMVLQAAVAVLLGKLGGGEDIPLGARAESRPDASPDEVVGQFSNLLVLRTDVSGDPAFDDLVGRVREANLDAYAGLDIPFERLVEAINPLRSVSRHPLFQILLTMRPSLPPLRLAALETRRHELPHTASRHDLTFGFEERRAPNGAPDGIEVRIGYSRDLFGRTTAQGLGDRLLRVLLAVTDDPRRKLSGIDVLDPAERHRLLVEWNDTSFKVPDSTLPDMLETQVARTPDLPAVQMGDTVLTYAELDARTNQLARHLISQGVGAESVVALAMPRSVEVIVALWATLKAGGAYLPIDPGYPAERIQYMLEDAKPVLTLTEPIDVSHLPATDITDADRIQPLRPEHPIYVIYTSGSTGRPKAVVMPGYSLVSLLTWYETTLTPGRMAQFSSLSFDTSAFEVLFATTSGGCLVVPPEEVRRDVDLFAQWLVDYDVHDMNLPNLVLDALCEVTGRTGLEIPELRMIAQGGEALTLSPRLKTFFEPPRRRLDNYYGPTETHLAIAQSFPPSVDDWPDEPLLGRPTGNMRGYVLDERLQPVPVGVVGELYLAGEQLSRGYLNRPSATASRFVANPFDGPGSRMYRTGDLVRWRKDGHLVFLGRVDHQVKIRGFRVELGEIESVLRRHRSVAQAAVLAVEDRPGTKRLVAYVVAETGPVDVAALRAHVAESLPDYMVPWAFVQLDEMPLNPNRKLDRAALPKPTENATRREPRTAVERTLCDVYAEVLAAPTVSIDDNFFHLGGSSLTAVRLADRIEAVLGAALPVRQLFEHPTPAELASFLSQGDTAAGARKPDRARGAEHTAERPAGEAGRTAGAAGKALLLPGPEARVRLLCELFADILERDAVSAEDNFFALGGHSLLATRLLNRIRDTFGVELSLTSLFDHPTPAGTAELLGSGRAARPSLLARR
ncbi:amino acid adenylation domain-containing protein [Streptomyces violaceusniger]|uniref:non-ribosomal peptide synthetase n=1 Tax=Streptomyces violaceusniger TaxID=68280 RepID=UPI0036940494